MLWCPHLKVPLHHRPLQFIQPSIHPSIHEQTPPKKDTYRLGKNDVLPRTAHPHKSGYTSYEATHETSSEPCRHDTSSTGTLRRTPCMERSPICTPGRASTLPCWTSSFAGSNNTCPP